MKKVVGITGGIGSGKSVIGKMLTTMGYPVYYSDQAAKELMEIDAMIIKELNQLFDNKAYDEGKLNRTYLAQQIFSNPKLKNKVNQIVHPRVRAHFKEFVEKQSSPLVFNEAAILFETGGDKNFDAIILVVADEGIRIERVINRDGIAKEEVINRINNQWSDEKKKKLTEYVITNNPTDLLVPQLNKILEKLSN